MKKLDRTRVLLLCQHFYPEMVSTGLHMTELGTALVERDPKIQLRVLCTKPSKKGFTKNISIEEIYKGVEIVRFNNFGTEHGSIFQRFLFSFSFFLKALFYSILEIPKTDLILVTTNPPFIGLIPYIISKFSRIPYITIIYDIYPDIAVKLQIFKPGSLIVKIWASITNLIFNGSRKVVVIGVDMKAIIAKKIKESSKIVLIHNWSDSRYVFPIKRTDNLFIKEHNLQGKKILLYSGNMGRTHNVEPFLRAAIQLQSLTEIVFIFIGSGQKRIVIENTILENNLSNIMLLDYQPYEILNHVLSCADLSLVCLENDFSGYSVPSKTYGILAAGRPVLGILKADSEIALTITKHDCGKIFESEIDGKTLADNILSLVNNEEEINRMGLNGYRAFRENFDLSISADKYLKVIREVVS